MNRMIRKRLPAKILALIEEHDLELRQDGRNHWAVLRDGRRLTTLSTSPGDHRTRHNEYAQLRRALREPH